MNIMRNTIVEEHSIDIDNNNIEDKIILKGLSCYEDDTIRICDPGVYNEFILVLNNRDTIIIDHGFDRINNHIKPSFTNEINSDLAYIFSYNNRKILYLLGPWYGCCFANNYFYEFKNGTLELLGKPETTPCLIKDINNDGFAEFISYDNFPLETHTDCTTLHSFQERFIYTLKDTLIYNKGLSDQLNIYYQKKYGNYSNYDSHYLAISPESDTTLVDYWVTNIYKRDYSSASTVRLTEKNIPEKYGDDKTLYRLIRNEIFAAHGYIFKSDDLREYFKRKKWYKPLYHDVSKKLTDLEKHNIQTLLKLEKK